MLLPNSAVFASIAVILLCINSIASFSHSALSTYREAVTVKHTQDAIGIFSIADEGVQVNYKKLQFDSSKGKGQTDIWNLAFSIKECMVDIPSHFSIWLRGHDIPGVARPPRPTLSSNIVFFEHWNKTGPNVIKLAKTVSSHVIGSDGCRHYNASIDVYDPAQYRVTVMRDFLGSGALFTTQHVDYLKTFPIYHATDPDDYNSSYASRWEEFGNRTLGITEWLRSLSKRRMGSFDVTVGQREIASGNTKIDAWLDLPYCHDTSLVAGIGAGGRWIGGSWVVSNCILAQLSLETSSQMLRGMRVRILGDSNMHEVMTQVTRYICGHNITAFQVWENYNNCPPNSPNQPPAPFSFVYKLYRGVTTPWDDQLSGQILNHDEKSSDNSVCRGKKIGNQKYAVFDYENYNATIILPGLWQVSQRASGYPQRLASKMRSVLQRCRSLPEWKASGHLVLLQETTSVDSSRHEWYGGWRRCRNVDLENNNRDQTSILRSQVDSVIPVFDMSMWAYHGYSYIPEHGRIIDPVHYWPDFYKAVYQLQIVHLFHALHKTRDRNNKKNRFKSANDYWFLNVKDQQ